LAGLVPEGFRVKRAAGVLVAIAVSGGLLSFAFRDLDAIELAGILTRIRGEWLPMLVAWPFLDIALRSWRWQLLLAPAKDADLWTLFKLECVGIGINNLLFLRAGDLARALFTARALEIPAWSCLATILVERLCDVAAMLMIFGAASWRLHGVFSPALRHSSLLASGLVLALLLGVAAFEHVLERFRFWRRLESRHPRLHRLIRELILGTRALRRRGRASAVVALSFAIWLCEAGVFWAMGQALGFAPPLDFVHSLATMAAASAASALPAVPGAFGNFEASVRAVLVHFGYSAELAVVYAAFLHLTIYAVVTGTGILLLNRLGFSVAGISRDLGRPIDEMGRS
jgi:uncharacterized protein (TIRG00374 family)